MCAIYDSRRSVHDPLQFVGPDFRRICEQWIAVVCATGYKRVN